jgi:hypothetical protein
MVFVLNEDEGGRTAHALRPWEGRGVGLDACEVEVVKFRKSSTEKFGDP